MGRDFDEQGIVTRRDDSTGISRAGIEADAGAAAAAVVVDFAGIRHEVVLRILGRDAALDGYAAAGHIGLALNADFRVGQSIAFGHANLRLDDIDIRNGLSDRMLDLYTRVDLNEVEMFFILVSEEFNCAGVDIMHVLHDFQGRCADFFAEFLGQGPGWCHFDDVR